MDEISSLDWDIVPKDEYEYDWVAEPIKEVKNFLKQPNKNYEPFSHIVKALLKDILEIDAGVLVKVFDINSYDFNEIEPKSGAPMLKPKGQRRMTEVYARDGASFLKEMDKFGFVKGYWQYSYQIPAHPMWFDREEIVYVSEHNRSMSPYGYARTQSILDIVKSLHYSTLYNKKFFEETPIPDGALSLLDTNEIEMGQFRNYWNNEFKAQPHKVAVINKDVKWQPFAVSQRELEFLDTQKWYFNIVISAFGLTPTELGITDDANRAVSATQAELVKRKGVRPFLKLLEDHINSCILSEFNYEGIEFQFIYDDPAEKSARLANWQTELNMGVKTVNEVRNELGLEPIDGGDISNNIVARMGQSQDIPGKPGVPQETMGGRGKGEAGDTKQEQREGAGYKDTLAREEAQHKSNEAKDEQEKKRQIQQPFSDNRRPVGNFKSANKVDLPNIKRDILLQLADEIYRILVASGMSMQQAANYSHKLKERARIMKGLREGILVESEHEDTYNKLVDFLEQNGRLPDKEEFFAMIATDHITEDKLYYEHLLEMEALYKGLYGENVCLHKGVDDGQYYRDQPISQPFKPSGAHFQPQNPRPNDTSLPTPWSSLNTQPHTDTAPSHLGDSRSEPGVDTWENKDIIKCPICGMNTLAYLASLEVLPDDVRCTNCGARFKGQDLMNAPLMEEISNTLQANNMTNPVNMASNPFVPKSFNKSFDEKMDVKNYCGFDISKSLPYLHEYANSEEYKDLIKNYLSDLPVKKINTIIAILKNSLSTHETISNVAKKLETIVGDKQRAMNIARTEVIRIANEGNLEHMEQKGIRKAQFLAAPEDGRLCKECLDKNKKIFTVKEARGMIPVHPKCRCSWLEVDEPGA